MCNRPFPGGLLELLPVVTEELRCVEIHRRESVKGHIRGLEKGPDHTEELGYRYGRAPLIMIKITHLPTFCDLRMEDWGSKYKLRRLCNKTAVTPTLNVTDSGEFYLLIRMGSHMATPYSVKTCHLLSIVISGVAT